MASLSAARSFARIPTAATLRPSHIARTQRSAFSAGRTVLSPQNQNPEMPRFSLKDISSNPRTRFWVGTAFVTLACIEAAAWFKFWPKITGKGSEEPSST